MLEYLKLVRPADWVKNVFVLAGLVFSQRATESEAILLSLLAFAAFCLAASAAYVINDIRDREQDRLHPTKRHRPIASGAISPERGIILAFLLLSGAIGLCLLLPRGFAVVLGAYLMLNAAYTYWLKRRVIVDVIVIAIGFVLRAIAGGVAIGAGTSPWLVVCTFTLCMFIGFGKRQCEINTIGDSVEAAKHRKTLAGYSPDLLNHLTSVTAGIAIVTFLLYVMDRGEPQPPFDKHYLILTLPLVVYAIFRYAMLIRSGRASGPVDIVLKDRPFILTVFLWVAAAVVVVYWGRHLRGWLGLTA
ncbi:MAG: decaprenyl-phosphate phosphoribosyltransferase [Phycisphaerae bacterium]|nr:decaprenyl-phosphate phosphoribosyltransferase [Phycisphaerae bacterium]